MPPCTVLYVDSRQRPSDVVEEILKAAGHAVTTATTGSEAISMATNASFSLIITGDVLDMTGSGIAGEMKRCSPGTPLLRILSPGGDHPDDQLPGQDGILFRHTDGTVSPDELAHAVFLITGQWENPIPLDFFSATRAPVLVFRFIPGQSLILSDMNPAAEKFAGDSFSCQPGMGIEAVFPALSNTGYPEICSSVIEGKIPAQSFAIPSGDDAGSSLFATVSRGGPGCLVMELITISDTSDRDPGGGNRALEVLHATALELASIPPNEQLQTFAIRHLMTVTGAKGALFLEYNAETQTLTPTRLEIEPGLSDRLIQILQRKPEEMVAVLDQDSYTAILDQIVRRQDSLTAVTFGLVPPEKDKIIKQLTGFDRFIRIGYVVAGELYGTSIIGLKPGQQDPSIPLLEASAHLIAVSLRRQQAERISRRSTELYRAMILASPDTIIIVDKAGIIRYYSPRGAHFFRLSGDRPSTGTHFTEWIVPEDRETASRHFASFLATGVMDQITFRFLREDGTVFFGEVNGTASRIRGGENIDLVCVIRDISDRIATEKAMYESELLYRTIAENSPDAIYTMDTEGRYRYVNTRAALNLGCLPEEVSGKKPDDFFNREIAEQVREKLSAAFSTGRELTEHVRIPINDQFYHLFSYFIPLPDPDGSIPRVLGIAHDITELKRAEEALRKSEETLRVLMDTMPDAIAIIDWNGVLLFANHALGVILGCPERDLTGKSVFLFMHPDFRDTVWEDIAGRRSEHGLKSSDYQLLTPDGREPWIGAQWIVIPFQGQEAILIGIRDITGRKAMEIELREEKERYRQITENMADMIAVCRLDSTYQYVSPSYKRVLGYSPEELEGTSTYDRVHPDDLPRLIDHEFFDLLNGKRNTILFRHMHRDGRYRWIETTGKVIPEHEGRGSMCIISSRDVSGRVEMENTLRKAQEKISILSSITRHDVMNQLQAVETFCFLLEDRLAGDKTGTGYLGYLCQATEKIRQQISFAKDYQDLGENMPVWQDVAITARMAATSLLSDGILLDVMVMNRELFADPMFMLAFHNLYENAARHGDHVTRISITWKESDMTGYLIITDNGTGIDPAEKREIFEKGYGSHTGLGLFLVKEILSITGLSIHEDGKFGEGARFVITIPPGCWRPGRDCEA